MNRFLWITILAISMVACKTPQGAAGAITVKNSKDLAAEMMQRSNKAEEIRITAMGKYEMAKDKQSFKADIRMIRDSVIWIELSHPVLGIKAGRGILMPDSIAFINRIERTYMAGSVQHFSEILGVHIDFDIIQNLLLGEPMRNLNPKDKMHLEALESLYTLYVMPKVDPFFTYTDPNYYLEVDPITFRTTQQNAIDGVRKISATYSGSQMHDNNPYPEELRIVLAFDNVITLNLNYAEIKTDEPVRTPFKISSKYKRVN